MGNIYSRSHDAVIRVYDEAGNMIETLEQKGEFKQPWIFLASRCCWATSLATLSGLAAICGRRRRGWVTLVPFYLRASKSYPLLKQHWISGELLVLAQQSSNHVHHRFIKASAPFWGNFAFRIP
jgi:hypothetical protein